MQFSILGRKIRVSFWFVLFITIATLIDKTGAIIWGFAAAIVHEAAHVVVMVLNGSNPQEIQFNFFEVNIIDKSRCATKYKNDIQILLAGPTSNLFMAFLFYFIYKVSHEEFLLVPFIENLVLGVLNFLPIASLDGGQLMYMFLSRKMNPLHVERICRVISLLFLIPVFLLGVWILINSKGNFSLLIIGCYLFLAIINNENNFI